MNSGNTLLASRNTLSMPVLHKMDIFSKRNVLNSNPNPKYATLLL